VSSWRIRRVFADVVERRVFLKDRVRFDWEVEGSPRWEARKLPFSQADQPLLNGLVSSGFFYVGLV
jgi:hypothetical protein